jgi:undecaprenyl-diphosphatase
MEIIINLDKTLFIFFNQTLANPVFDWLMPIVTNQHNWNPVYIFIIIFLIWKYKQRGLFIVIVLAVSVGLSDFISSHFIKEWVGRLRPCWTMQNIHLLVPCGAGKSFPSSHSVNNFAVAVILSNYFKKESWIFYTLAALVAFSRVAVGVHYPFDILGGALIGSCIAYLVLFFTKKIKYLQKYNLNK